MAYQQDTKVWILRAGRADMLAVDFVPAFRSVGMLGAIFQLQLADADGEATPVFRLLAKRVRLQTETSYLELHPGSGGRLGTASCADHTSIKGQLMFKLPATGQ